MVLLLTPAMTLIGFLGHKLNPAHGYVFEIVMNVWICDFQPPNQKNAKAY